MINSISVPDEQVQSMLISGLGDVFRTMLQRQVELESCTRLTENSNEVASPLTSVDETLVVGNVGFAGVISGMVYIAMPESLAKEITGTMLGMDDDELEGEHEMVNDAIGELTNMSAGAFKNQMSDLGYPCRLTIPSIIRGKYFVVEAAKAAYRQFFVFNYMGHQLSLELIMKMNDMQSE